MYSEGTIVSFIHDEFLKEAAASPLLLSDLASMEKYISESYSGRSLIELIQNADDAGATRFLILRIKNNAFLIANNGRCFNQKDLLALCRSGSSSKKRKTGTIGFRGIGFKSIVNYAHTVYLTSGDINAVFSREMTSAELSYLGQVPLIRVPHEANNPYASLIRRFQGEFTTFFVFETKTEQLVDEVDNFDINAMIFLRYIEEFIFINGDRRKNYYCSRNLMEQSMKRMVCFDGSDRTEWIVFDSTVDECNIAFKSSNGVAVAATQSESVFHSFMPTSERVSIPFKVNGDFSTDPSRTKIINDADTNKALNVSVKLLVSLIMNIINQHKDPYRIINVICHAKVDPLATIRGKSINDEFIERLFQRLKIDLQQQLGENVCLQRKGITNGDFLKAAAFNHYYGIGQDYERDIPGILELLKKVGINEISTEQLLKSMIGIVFDASSRAQVLADVIHETRFGINNGILPLVKQAKLIDCKSGVLPVCEMKSEDIMSTSFQGAVQERLVPTDSFEQFAKQIGITCPDQQNDNNKKGNNKVTFNKGSETIFKNWRKAEENFAIYMKSLPEVKEVFDVAEKNLGYDIEVVLKDGTVEFYEIKTVKCLGDSFSMTNNELTSAMQYKNQYYVAIVQQTIKKFNICLICDPANTLMLNKRVTRWEWYCNTYSGDMVTLNG